MKDFTVLIERWKKRQKKFLSLAKNASLIGDKFSANWLSDAAKQLGDVIEEVEKYIKETLTRKL